MNCYYHAEAPAVAFCRLCGRPLCGECQRPVDGTVFCPEHAPVVNPTGSTGDAPPSNPYFQPAPGSTGVRSSPALAFGLGWIPGVGAICNGQYIKGLVHAVIFGLLVSLMSNNENGASAPLFGILLTAFIFYMPFEAYHTAKKLQAGVPVDEWSSFAQPGAAGRRSSRGSMGPVILIGIGVLFLLDTLDLVNFHTVARFWPLVLIAAGVYMLYSRTTGRVRDQAQFGPPYASPVPGPATSGPVNEFGDGRHGQ